MLMLAHSGTHCEFLKVRHFCRGVYRFQKSHTVVCVPQSWWACVLSGVWIFSLGIFKVKHQRDWEFLFETRNSICMFYCVCNEPPEQFGFVLKLSWTDLNRIYSPRKIEKSTTTFSCWNYAIFNDLCIKICAKMHLERMLFHDIQNYQLLNKKHVLIFVCEWQVAVLQIWWNMFFFFCSTWRCHEQIALTLSTI